MPTAKLPLRKIAAVISGATTADMAEDPKLTAYVDERSRRKNTAEQAGSAMYPAAFGGLAAAGYGAKRLGDAFLTPGDRAKLDDFFSLQNSTSQPADAKSAWTGSQPSKDIGGTPKLMYDYIDRASRASTIHPYGYSIPEVVVGARKAMFSPDSPWGIKPGHESSAAEHYIEFGKGPVPAFMHQIEKYRNNDDVRGFMFNPPAESVSAKLPADTVARWRTQVPDSAHLPDINGYVDRMHNEMDKYLQQMYNTPLSHIHEKLDHAGQMEALKGFDAHLEKVDPNFKALKDVADTQLAAGQSDATRAYGGIGHMATALLQDAPRYAGYAAMGAGALGLVWWLLKRRQAAQDKQNRLVAPKITV